MESDQLLQDLTREEGDYFERIAALIKTKKQNDEEKKPA